MTPRPRTLSAPIRAILYVRVSTDGQADSGLSLEHQAAKCQQLADLHDYQVVEAIVDAGESAKSLQRPGITRLLELVKRREVEAVVVAKLDRITRSVRDLGDIIELFNRQHVALISVSESLNTETAAGRMIVRMLGTIAEWEREAIGERTRDALSAKRRRGQVYGAIPYGSRLSADGVTLEADSNEGRMLARLQQLRADGCTWKSVADELNREGYRNRAGRPWILTNVRAAWLTAQKSVKAPAAA
jgi:DNA invertase Pin-like site-specific DNA recombinase